VSETALTRQGTSRSAGAGARLRGRLRTEAWDRDAAFRAVCAGTAAYALLFVFAAVMHYVEYKTGRFDNGDMVQAIWSTMHGHFFESTTLQGHQASRLGAHVDPFLLLFVPLFWISSSPLILPVVQALAVASGALPVFWLGRKHLGSSRAAAQFAFAYLLYPATQFNAFTNAVGFHSVSMAVPLVLFAIWFLDEDRLVAFSIFAVLAASTKEEMALAVGCLGIWYAVRTGRKLFGFTVFAIGLALTVFNFLWVIPHFSPTGAEPFAGRYRAVGGTPTGIVHKFFTDPTVFVHAVATGHKATFLALLFVPVLFLCLLEPLLFLGAVPDLLINLLSSKSEQTMINYQYAAGIVPFVFAASIFGAARFKRQVGRISLWVLALAACTAIYSPTLVLISDVPALGSPVAAAQSHAIGLIPKGAPVSASNLLGGYLSERRYISTFPYVARAKWIIVDANDQSYGTRAQARASGIYPDFKRTLQKYKSDKAWRIVYSSHGITVLRKQPPPRG
jgi:uncharacterized membrane protein